MAQFAKKPTSDTTSTSIGLGRPSYFRRLSALFGGRNTQPEVETVPTEAAPIEPAETVSGPTASTISSPNGRIVSLRTGYVPPQSAEPWMKHRADDAEGAEPRPTPA